MSITYIIEKAFDAKVIPLLYSELFQNSTEWYLPFISEILNENNEERNKFNSVFDLKFSLIHEQIYSR